MWRDVKSISGRTNEFIRTNYPCVLCGDIRLNAKRHDGDRCGCLCIFVLFSKSGRIIRNKVNQRAGAKAL